MLHCAPSPQGEHVSKNDRKAVALFSPSSSRVGVNIPETISLLNTGFNTVPAWSWNLLAFGRPTFWEAHLVFEADAVVRSSSLLRWSRDLLRQAGGILRVASI
jgi:hypothetical protein